jgi:hypothetical protein
MMAVRWPMARGSLIRGAHRGHAQLGRSIVLIANGR